MKKKKKKNKAIKIKKNIKKRYNKKKIVKKNKKKFKKKRVFKKNNSNIKQVNSKSTLLKIIRLQEKLKPKFKFNLFDIIERNVQGFFSSIENKIEEYKFLRKKEKDRIKLETIEREQKERIERDKKIKEEKEEKLRLREIALKEEIKIEKERTKDIKLFLRKEQAIIRKEQAEKQKKFLQQLKLDKQIEKFRIREIKELEKLERISLREQRDDYSGLQDRIEKLKEKYRIIRDQKIRERVEALGVSTEENDDRETLLRKEREYTISRQKIEFSLESFYRSASSLVFQLNKRHITRHMSILRCIDKRFETGEIFIKWDESNDNDWLILIYIKDNSPDEGIVIEDKSNPEKNLSHEYKSNEIFKASDMMVDSLTQLISKERSKKKKLNNLVAYINRNSS